PTPSARRAWLGFGIRGAGLSSRTTHLSAGGHDVAAARNPDEGGDAPLYQHLLKLEHAGQGRRLIGQPLARIVGDQVDPGRNASEERGDPRRIRFGVVEAVEHDVLESESLPWPQRISA